MFKKGFISTFVAAPWFIIIFFFAAIIFLFIFSVVVPRVTDEIRSEINDQRLSFSMLNFFRMDSSEGNVQDLFYFYSKDLNSDIFSEIRIRMREFLSDDTCVEVIVKGEKISGDHFNDCDKRVSFIGEATKLVDSYESDCNSPSTCVGNCLFSVAKSKRA